MQTKQQGKAAIDDESSNAPCNPGAATEAIPEGQAASGAAQAFRMNLVREPDAGNPHVRFDEREVETEYGTAREAPTTERVGNR